MQVAIISGDTVQFCWTTDRGVKLRLALARKREERWYQAYRRLNGHTGVGINVETGEAREIAGWPVKGDKK
jgi:hypothetical protein